MKTTTFQPLQLFRFMFAVALASLTLLGLAQASIRVPSSIRDYDPFTATVTFSQPYCLSDTYPLVGETDLKGQVLSIVLPHLKTGPCSSSRQVKVPGLPGGNYTLKISVSKNGWTSPVDGGATGIAETVSEIVQIVPTTSLRVYATGRLYAYPVGTPLTEAETMIVMLSNRNFWPITQGSAPTWLEVGSPDDTAYTFLKRWFQQPKKPSISRPLCHGSTGLSIQLPTKVLLHE